MSSPIISQPWTTDELPQRTRDSEDLPNRNWVSRFWDRVTMCANGFASCCCDGNRHNRRGYKGVQRTNLGYNNDDDFENGTYMNAQSFNSDDMIEVRHSSNGDDCPEEITTHHASGHGGGGDDSGEQPHDNKTKEQTGDNGRGHQRKSNQNSECYVLDDHHGSSHQDVSYQRAGHRDSSDHDSCLPVYGGGGDYGGGDDNKTTKQTSYHDSGHHVSGLHGSHQATECNVSRGQPVSDPHGSDHHHTAHQGSGHHESSDHYSGGHYDSGGGDGGDAGGGGYCD